MDRDVHDAGSVRSGFWSIPFAPSLPLVFGSAIAVSIVAFVAGFTGGNDAVDALKFSLATLLAGVMACGVVLVVGASGKAIQERRWGLFLLLRLVVPAIGLAWYYFLFRRTWVSLSDLAAGFTAIPVGAGIYHRHWLKEHYCKVDPRTLGLFRLVLGFLLASDCIRHWKEARYFYSNAGMLTNHYHLFRPSGNYNLSIFHAFSTLEEVHVAFALSFVCYFLFMVGYRTRLFSILSFVFVTSMDNRLVMVENGGYVVVNLLAGWSTLMPLGLRFSVDAALRSFREHKERGIDDLDRRFRPKDKHEPNVSAIYLIVLLNVAFVYFFNVVNKSGRIWKVGDTVHYVLHLDRMVTGVAVFFREHMPQWAMKATTWLVLLSEGLIFAWILSPYGRRYTRPLAMLFMAGLHTALGVMMRLGPFSWFMIGWSYLLPVRENWADLSRWYRKKASARTVVLDRDSPLAFFLGRALARLDGLDLLRFEPSPEGAADPPLFAARDEKGNVATGMEAYRQITDALPGGRYFRKLLFVAMLGTPGLILRFVSARRAGVARFFGLGPSAQGESTAPKDTPLRQRLGRIRVTARECLIAYLGVCATFQMVNENKSVPPQLKPKMPSYMTATIGYPRMFQGWGMFAANPITDDGAITIDAVTVTGRRVDPFTNEPPDLDLTDARGLGLNQIWQDYMNRIRLERNKAFRAGLKEYLLRWHEQTGNPADELVAFDVYWLRDQCPPPGQLKPSKLEKIAILTYRKPGYRPAPGLPPLPPEPKVGNAETPQPDPQRESSKQRPEPDQEPGEEKRESGDAARKD